MISVEQRETIRRAYYIEQKSIRRISRELGHSRRTIRNALASADTPARRGHDRHAPKLGPFKDRINELLRENQTLPRKQRYTSRKIFECIRQEGYQGSESNLRGYIGRLRRQENPPPVYLPLEFDPGQDAQVDWGEAQVIMNGEQQTVQLFCMRLNYSRRLFVMAFPSQNQESFFEGHVQAFHFFEGVPHRLTYDNLKTAVKRVLEGRNREEQQSFIVFRSHYLFESHFCAPGQGHEKGGIEHAVGYARRNFMVPLPEVDSFDALNLLLLKQCHQEDSRQVHGQSTPIGEAWASEKQALRPLPGRDFSCCRTTSVSLTPYSQVIFETNRYSVPVDHARQILTLQAFPFQVRILHQEKVIAVHDRCYAKQTDVFDPHHYLPILAQRPAAFEHSKPIRRWRENWPEVYDELLIQLKQQYPDGAGIRQFIRILQLHREYPVEQMEAAIRDAISFGCPHLDGVRLCLHQQLNPGRQAQPLSAGNLSRPELAAIGQHAPDLTQYNQLLEEVTHG